MTCGFWTVNALLMDYLFKQISSSNQTLLLAASLILIAINYAFAFYLALFSHDPFISTNSLSCHSPNFQAFTVLFKAIAAPLIFQEAEDGGSGEWAFVIVSLLIMLAKLYSLIGTFPYYKYQTMKIALAFNVLSLWICFLNFLSFAGVSEYLKSSKVLAYTQIPASPLVLSFALSALNNETHKYFSIQLKDLKTFTDVVKKIFAIRFLIERTKLTSADEDNKTINELRFYGVLAMNENQQTLSNITSLLGEDNKINRQAMARVFQALLEETADRFKKNIKIHTLISYFALNSNSPYEVTIFRLGELAKLQGGTRLITSKLYSILQKNMTTFFDDNKDTILDLNQFLEQEAISSELVKAVKSVITKYLAFWGSYFKTSLKIKDFYIKSKEIEKISEDIDSLWKRYSETNKLFAGSICHVYSLFCNLLRAAPFQAQLINQQYSQLKLEQIIKAENEKTFSNESLSGPATFTIHSTITKENPGTILRLSPNFDELTGWSATEILGHNVNVLLPPFIAYCHNRLLLNHIKRLYLGRNSKRMYTTLDTYFMHKEGHILPCGVYISLHPVVQDTPVYLVFIRIQSGAPEQILVSQNGNIEGFTQKIGQLLDLKNKTKSSCDAICKNFLDVQKAMEQVEYDYIHQDPNSQVEIKQSLTADFRLPRKNQRDEDSLQYIVDVYPYHFDGKLYFSLSFTQQKDHHERVKIQTQLVKEEESSMSEILDEFPERNALKTFDNILTPTNSRRRGTTRFGTNLFGTSILDTKKSQLTSLQTAEDEKLERLHSPKKTTTLLLAHKTTVNSNNNFFTVDTVGPALTSFIVEETQTHPVFSSHRELLASTHKNAENIFEEKNQIQDANLIQLEMMAASSVGTSSKKSKSKFEQALTIMPSNKQIHWLYLTFISLMVISGVPLIVFDAQTKNALKKVQIGGDVISNMIYRMIRFTDLSGYSRTIWQSNIGIIEPDRYAPYGYTQTLQDYVLSTFPLLIDDIRNTNEEIRSSVPEISQKFTEQLYQATIPVFIVENDGSISSARKDNLFSLSTDLINNAIKLENSGQAIDGSNPYLLFIMNNTMNAPLVTGEEDVPILLEDSISKLNGLSVFTYCLMGAIGAASLLVFAYFTFIMRVFIKERNQFLHTFASLDEKLIQEQLLLIEAFYGNLTRAAVIHGASKSHFQSVKINNKGAAYNKKSIDGSGIDKVFHLLYLAILCFCILIFSAYPILYSTVNSSTKIIHEKIDIMTQSNLNFYTLMYCFNGIYSYIQEPYTAYIRNKPAGSEIAACLQDLSKVQDFIVKDLLSSDYGLAENPLLYNTAVGNICEIYTFSDPNLESNCATFANGAATKGIVSLNSYILYTLQNVYQCFEASEKTFADQHICLGLEDLINLEVFYPYIYEAYKGIDVLIREEMVLDYDGLQGDIDRTVWIYVVLYIILGSLFGWNITKKLDNEMIDWRKLLRQIPYPVAIESKMLKVYIQRTRGDILGGEL